MPVRDDANDIVARLRDCTCIPHGEICREAADEIEKLRGRLLGEENACDIMRIERENMEKDQNNLSLAVEDIMMRNQKLTLENELLRRERDEARRLYCEEWAFNIELERGEASDPRDLANEKKWDCYKEIHNEE
jgi:hypothetical protein